MGQIIEIFYEMCAFLIRRGHEDLKSHEGILHENVDDDWSVDFNHHAEDVELDGTTISAFTARISYNSLPVAIIGAGGCVLLGGSGDGSVKDDFIAAVKAA